MSTIAPKPATEPTATATVRRASDTISKLQELGKIATSTSDYYRKSFHVVASHFGTPYGEINVRVGASSVEETYRSNDLDPTEWLDIIDALLLECESEAHPVSKVFRGKDGNAFAGLSTPITTNTGAMIGAVVVSVRVQSRSEIELLLNELSCFASLMAGYAPGTQAKGPATSNVEKGTKAIAKAAEYTSIRELAFAITNSFATKLSCEQVALGLIKRQRVKLLSISGMDDIPKNSPGVQAIKQSMEECMDVGKPIACRFRAKGESKDASRYLLHEKWSESASNAAVASIPVVVGDTQVAIISMRRRNEDPFTEDQIEKALQLIEPFAPAILVVEKASRSAFTHTVDSLTDQVIDLFKPKKIGRKLIALSALIFAMWFCFGQLTHSVTVPCVIQPVEVRHVSAPFEAVIKEALVVAGDQVHAGQILVKFDTSKLELERAHLISQIEMAKIEKKNAINNRDLAAASLADANIKVQTTQLEVTEKQIVQSTIRAFSDGTIIVGDLSKKIGQTVRPDETLFELATTNNWYVELKIPEVDVPHLKAGMKGEFASFARPDQPVSCVIERIVPSAEAIEGKNVFLAETRVEDNPKWMRVGMEGVARIDVGPKQVWWVALHKAVDFVRMKLWI